MSDEPVSVEILLPLPLDVAATLCNVIGTAYPNAQMKTNDVHRLGSHHMQMLIPQDDRFKNKTSKKKFLAAKQHLDSEHEGLMTELRNGLPTIATPEYVAKTMGFMAEQLFDETPGAVNYVEMEVRNPDTNRKWLVTVAKSERQRPSVLHQEAKAEIERLMARIAELEGR